MKVTELLEAAYDGMVDRMVRQHPQWADAFEANLRWARQNLKKSDRVVWWLKIAERMLTQNQQVGLNNYARNLEHLMSIQFQPIQDYQFGNQEPADVIDRLYGLESDYKERQHMAQPLRVQPGDKVIQDFGNGYQWVYTNRAFCADEGRSGRHCGNVVGHHKPDQRIISLRRDGHVECTFILEPNGRLGEMKGRGNTKPSAQLHPYILWLLEQPFIRGINGGGYAPEHNFAIRDLTDQQIAHLRQVNPTMDIDQDLNTSVLALQPQNASVIQDIMTAINDTCIDKLDMVFFDPRPENQEGSRDVMNFIEYIEWIREYDDPDDYEDEEDDEDTPRTSLPTLHDIPDYMAQVIDNEVENADNGHARLRYTDEQYSQLYQMLTKFTLEPKLNTTNRTGQWTLRLGGETVQTGRFRY